VSDLPFDQRLARVLAEEYSWMNERTLQIRDGLLGHGRPLTATVSWLSPLESVDSMGH